NLMLRYYGIGKNLSHDEEQILMFALELESRERGGIAAECLKVDSFVAERRRCRECLAMMHL
ncbi:MAG TPA: hypothetical protein VFO27_16340, partial [Bryobacteraceae bacterium]|nr:hypothetical protein [Bryobacteraceae bacterium]